jgi:hypothetical protein
MAAWKPRGMKTRQQPRKNRPCQSSSKPKDKSSEKPYSDNKFKSSRGSYDCHNCLRLGYFARDCKTLEYFVKMYQELQRLKSRQREIHTQDAPSLENVEPKNFMVSMDKSKANPNVTLLDSANTHTILRDLKFSYIFQPQSWCLTRVWCDHNCHTTTLLLGGPPFDVQMQCVVPQLPEAWSSTGISGLMGSLFSLRWGTVKKH